MINKSFVNFVKNLYNFILNSYFIFIIKAIIWTL